MTWPSTTIGHLCLPTEQRDPTASPDKFFRYIDISAIDKAAKRIIGVPELLGAEAPSRARKAVRAGDVLVSTVRPNLNAVAMVPDELDGQIASTGFCVLRANPELADAKFIFYRCLTPEFVNTLVAQMRGANYPAVSDGVVKRADTPAPTPKEQRRIVELLEQADGLRWKRAEADALADRILPALFHKMFGEPDRNPKNWPVVPLKQLGVPWSGGAFPLDEQGQSTGEVPFIKVSDMNLPGNERFIRTANHWVSRETLQKVGVKAAPTKTIVFPKIGAAIATNKKRMLTRETAFDNNVQGVVPVREEHAFYLLAFFERFDLMRLARVTTLPSIRPSELALLPVPNPPLPLQQRFGELYEQACRTFQEQVGAGSQLETLFQVVLHQAFTGELTAKWREAHMKELLAEMEQQARLLTRRTNTEAEFMDVRDISKLR